MSARRWAAVLPTAALAAFLAGCGGPQEPSEAEKEATVQNLQQMIDSEEVGQLVQRTGGDFYRLSPEEQKAFIDKYGNGQEMGAQMIWSARVNKERQKAPR